MSTPAGHDSPSPDRAAANPLHSFYESPDVLASSGPDRAQRQARMLTEVLRGSAAPARIVDVGCGDGTATGLAARLNPDHHVIGMDWSADILRRAGYHGLTLVQAGVDPPGLPAAAEGVDAAILSELIHTPD